MKKSLLLLLFLVMFSNAAHAANILLENDKSAFAQGEEFLINVIFSPEGEPFNALEGTIIFPTELLEVVDIRRGGSIVSFWLDQPRSEGNQIYFSGIIPGGFQFPQGLLFSFVVRTKKEGRGALIIKDGKVFANDGKGSEVAIKNRTFLFTVSGEAPSTISSPSDTYPPEDFVPELTQDENIFEGKTFLIFSTQDKISGISRYEIREGIFSPFVEGESPYLLKNQNLDKKIFVKAIDKSGNEKIVTVHPPFWKPWYKDMLYLFSLAFACVVLFTFRKKVYKIFHFNLLTTS